MHAIRQGLATRTQFRSVGIGYDATVPAESPKGVNTIHGARRELREGHLAMVEDRLEEGGKRQSQAGVHIRNVDRDISGQWMRGDKVPMHLVLRYIFVLAHFFPSQRTS